jgi:hypothetical protein
VRRLLPLFVLPLLAGCAGAAPPAARPVAEPLPPLRAGPAAPALLVESRGARTLFRLIQQNGEQRLWRSEGGQVLATSGARLVASAAGDVWLAATRFEGPDPLDDPAALLFRRAEARRVVDLSSPSRSPEAMRFGVVAECRLTAAPTVEEGRNAILVTEECSGTGQGFPNRFWADAQDGRIYRSEQWAGGGAPLVLSVVAAE